MSFYFYKSTQKSANEAKQLRDQLTEMLNTHSLPFEVRDYAQVMLKRAGKTGLNKALAKIRKTFKEPMLEKRVANLSLCVVYGNTFHHREALANHGFKARKLNNNKWINFKEVYEDKFQFWKQALLDLDEELVVVQSKTLEFAEEIINDFEEAVKEEPKKVEATEIEDHEMKNKVLEMKAWFARILQEKTNAPIKFRNIKILKVRRETLKAYLVDIEFYSGIVSTCGVCGRALTNDISRMTGIGPICADRLNMPRPTIETAKEFMKSLDEKFKQIGQFESIWIAKSQIKKVHELSDLEAQNE